METISRNKLVSYLETNNLIKSFQLGFRNKRSCLTNLLHFYKDVLNMFDETKTVGVIYLDFQKTFDNIPHKRLLWNVNAYAITGNVNSWLEDWLTERKQRVVINRKSSD